MKSSLFLVAIISIALSVGRSFAGSATWATNARSNDWNTALNWTPQTIPNGPEDVATFASSRTTGVSVATAIDVNSIIFGTAASAFTVTVQPTDILTITGGGVTNNSGVTQNFSAAPGGYYTSDFGSIIFDGRATAGEQNVYTTKASPYYGSAAGYLAFYSDST